MFKIILADDLLMFREGLRNMLEKEGGLEIIKEVEDGRSAVRQSVALRPHIVVMDVGLPDLNGIEATRQIVEENPQTKVIGLSPFEDTRRARQMLKAGASGYVLKKAAGRELISAIKAVLNGDIYLCNLIAPKIARDFVQQERNPAGDAYEVLTGREREVLQLVSEGKAMKDIAKVLFVSLKTIQTHRKNVMEKLDLHSVAELTKYAIREGLTSLD